MLTYLYTHAHMGTHAHAHAHACAYTHTHAHAHACAYTHTHTHTLINIYESSPNKRVDPYTSEFSKLNRVESSLYKFVSFSN
jgi:hypothetical protein